MGCDHHSSSLLADSDPGEDPEESHRGGFGEFGGGATGLIDRTFRERIVLAGVIGVGICTFLIYRAVGTYAPASGGAADAAAEQGPRSPAGAPGIPGIPGIPDFLQSAGRMPAIEPEDFFK